jgi:hypothetical protein
LAQDYDANRISTTTGLSQSKATMLMNGLGALALEEQQHQEHFTSTMEMMQSLAKAQLIIGDFDACNHTTTEALSRCATVETKICLLLIAVEVRMAENKVDDAIFTANRALESLGVKCHTKLGLDTCWGSYYSQSQDDAQKEGR